MPITSKTDFGTDNGPRCTCDGTIYAYQVSEGHITVQCVGCHAYDYVALDTKPMTAAECSALHRAARRELDRQQAASERYVESAVEAAARAINGES
jgi:hypothetical protein